MYTKLNKARGVSFKLFEQYTEIMEGYVQIDACLNKCAKIAKDVSDTLAVWREAGMANDSVVGTPRSDGLNDVKVDVKKVSELLRKETDSGKKDILKRYIQTQPAILKEGTVLKDYQLLGINWLNLLFSKRIGCILADEMGEYSFFHVLLGLLTIRFGEDDPGDCIPRTFEREGHQGSSHDLRPVSGFALPVSSLNEQSFDIGKLDPGV